MIIGNKIRYMSLGTEMFSLKKGNRKLCINKGKGF